MSPQPPVPFFEHFRNPAPPNESSPSPNRGYPARRHDDARRERGACISCRSSDRTRLRGRGRTGSGGGRERTGCPLARQRRCERPVQLPFPAHTGSRAAHCNGCGRAGSLSLAIPAPDSTELRRSRPDRASSEIASRQFVTCSQLAIAQAGTCDAQRSRSYPFGEPSGAVHRRQGTTP